MVSHVKQKLRKIILLLVNALLNNPFIFKLIGKINNRCQWINSIFIAYPASKGYSDAYAFQKFMPIMKWTPWIAALMKYNGTFGIMMVISGLEKDFQEPNNQSNLCQLVQRVEKNAKLLNISHVTFAGILPGILYKSKIRQKTIEADITIQAILNAEKKIQQELHYSPQTPIIILGNNGFIGSRLIHRLNNRPIYPIDSPSVDYANIDLWPYQLKDNPCILINISRNFVLGHYTHLFWPQLIIINDVYPEPSKEEIDQIKTIGCPLFHIVGVEGKSWPKFPKVYKGGLPCCATPCTEDLPIIIQKLQ